MRYQRSRVTPDYSIANFFPPAARRVVSVVALLIALVGLLVPSSASAATRTVTILGDSGGGSLRDTIANASPGDTITFDPSLNGNTITLTSGQIVVDKNLTIQGPGAATLTVSGNNASAVFRVTGGNVVTISGLTISGGNSSDGGGIYTNGGLTLDSVQITGNTATNNGGGVYNDMGGALTLRNSTISDNVANGTSALGVAGGGGIYNLGQLTVTASTISKNTVQQFGGGLLNQDNGVATLTNVTISTNTSNGDAGGIYNNNGGGSINSLTLTNVTVTGNVARNGAGALDDFGSTTIGDTILAGNTAGNSNDCRTLYGALHSTGYNVIGDTTNCSFVGTLTGNQTGVNDPQLGPLDFYGGPTQTNLPKPGSPVIDAGGPTCPATDQRNVLRPSGGACDVGAVEIGPFTVTSTADSGPGTLRQAITDSNSFGQANTSNQIFWGASTIAFAIPGAGVHTIAPLNSGPTDALPVIRQPVTIDGWSQGGPTYTGPPLIEIDGEHTTTTFGLNIQTSDATVRGLAINRFPASGGNGFGIGIFSGNTNWIYGNYIGTDPTGLIARPNGQGGIWIGPEAIGNRIGTNLQLGSKTQPSGKSLSALSAQGNVISGNSGTGILIQGQNNTVSGNFIGVGSDGATALANTGNGVQINGTSNTVGGTQPGTANVIADNGGAGVDVQGGTNNGILGNSIYGNGGNGIAITPQANNEPSAPTVLTASPSGTMANATYIAGSLTNTTPNSPFRVELFSSLSCGAGSGQTFLGFVNMTTDGSGNGAFALNVPSAVPLTSVITATATNLSGELYNDTSQFSTCLKPTPLNDAWTRAKVLTLTGPTNATVTQATANQAIVSQGESLWYKVQILPGSTVNVTLTNLPASYQLTLYKDIGAAFQSATSTTDLEHLGAEFAPDAYSPDAYSPDAYSPDAYSPDAYSPDAYSPDAYSPDAYSPDAYSPDAYSPDAYSPDAYSPDAYSPDAYSPDAYSGNPSAYSSAQQQSLLAVSAFPGTGGQGVVVRTWENSGFFYIRVRGQNGAFDPNAQFQLTVTQTNLNCGSLLPVTTATSLTGTSGNYKTLVLTDYSRLPGTSADKTMLQNQLAAFVKRPEVQGVVVDVSKDARVADANSKADKNLSCPIAKNYVAESIQNIVANYRAKNPLQYVVLVGGDNVIPFDRYPDQALLANESDFSPPVLDSSASQASLKDGFTLTDDLYGNSVSLSLKANNFPVAGLAVGRLVETAAEANGMLTAYMSTNGGVVPQITNSSSPLVTGYDFLEPGATAVGNVLQASTGVQTATLIEANKLPPTDPTAWTATDLKNAFLGSRHDIVYLAGHFSGGSTLAADYSTRMLTSDVTSAAQDLTNEIIFSAGCHSGYNTVDADGIPSVTVQPDWPQAFAQKRATLIGGSGYQYGDTDTIKYSAQLYLNFSQELSTGTPGTPVTVGQALVAAKQYYLSNTPDLSGIHQKAVLEATLYGLPMLGVNLPNRKAMSSAAPFAAPTIATTNPGQTLGLSSYDVTVSQSFDSHSVTLTDPTTNQTFGASYLTIPDSSVRVNGVANQAVTDTLNNPTSPILPLEAVNANPTNNPNAPNPVPVLRGVGFRSGSYTDTANVLPLTSAPATELSATHAPFQSSVFFPIRPWFVNYVDALVSGGSGVTRFDITPAQYISSSPGSQLSTQRSFDNMSFRLYYSDNVTNYAGNVPALAAPPVITNVTSTVNGNTVTFSAHVTGAPYAGIQGVWVTYTGNASGDPGYGKWQSVDLVQDSSDSTLWSQSVDFDSPGSVRFMVQAVNGVGLVSLDSNLGSYYAVGVNPTIPPSTPPTPTTLTPSGPNPTTGAYGTTATFTTTLATGGGPLSGQTVTFVLSGQQHQVVTDGNGIASTSFNLISTPNPYSVQVSFAGTDVYGASSTAIPITITKRATKITLTTPNSATVQYSDPGVIATLTDDADHPLVGKTVFFVVSYGRSVVFGASAITGFNGQAQLGPILLSPQTQPYSVTASFGGTLTIGGKTTTFSDPNYSNSTTSTSFTVNPEDARAYYTGPMLVWTPKATSTTATVSLSATIKDISAVNPADDPNPGDIRNATVTFVNRDVTPNAVLCTSRVGLVSPTDPTVGTAKCNATLSATAPPHTVGIVVGGYYTRNDSADDTTITIAQPNVANSINGGGYLTMTNSAGQYAGDPGSNTNFGFNVTYNKASTNLQGSVDIIVRSQGHVYQIKGTSLSNLEVQTAGTPATATFQSKAAIIDITNPAKPVSVDGNATLQLDMTDNGNKLDALDITVWNKNSSLYFSSNWDGTRTIQQTLGGGGLSIQ